MRLALLIVALHFTNVAHAATEVHPKVSRERAKTSGEDRKRKWTCGIEDVVTPFKRKEGEKVEGERAQ
jgi:hypothetical protein